MTRRTPNRIATRKPQLSPLVAEIRQLKRMVGEIQPRRLIGDTLRELGDIRRVLDQVIDTGIDAGREAGYSWSEVGGALRISPQAAQQRHARRHS